ncbi:MAG: glycosyltransferase [Gracilimonas sp.]|nr:glycosyltransferase [Gracilimonas sp.]
MLVVDNNSEDETNDVVQKYVGTYTSPRTSVSYCREKQQGLSHARNQNVPQSEADNIVFIDDDIIATEIYVSTWLNFFQNFPDYKAAGGKIHVQFDGSKPKWVSHFLLSLSVITILGIKSKPTFPISIRLVGIWGSEKNSS